MCAKIVYGWKNGFTTVQVFPMLLMHGIWMLIWLVAHVATCALPIETLPIDQQISYFNIQKELAIQTSRGPHKFPEIITIQRP